MFDFRKLAEKAGLTPAASRGKKWLYPTVIAVVFILTLLIAGNALVLFELSHIDRFYPGSKIGGIDLSGMTKDEAFKAVERITSAIDQQTVQIEYKSNGRQEVLLLDQALSPDSANDYLEYDVYKTVYDNFNLGREGNWPVRLFTQWRLWKGLNDSRASFKLNSQYLKKIISNQLQPLETKQMDAMPQISCVKNDCQVEILAEKSGQSFDYDEAIAVWSDGLSRLEYQPIRLELKTVDPVIRRNDVIGLIDRLRNFMKATSTPEFYYQDKTWLMSKKDLAQMINFERGENNIYISLNQDGFNRWFEDKIGSELDVPAKNATILIQDGKITSMAGHVNGQEADKEKAYRDLKAKVVNLDFSDWHFELAVKSTTPEVLTEDINNLGIKEIIGVGESNFAGSPTNRRKNIKNGASRLNGLLIKPEEEFSLIKTLLPVDASTGYFPELVIKGNKTTPEYGGGLCQIGTTVFRAALSSGLPILERQNHSYSVTYYLEGGLPGVDATIYDPKPDLRFKNDTGNYILIQSRIVGDKLYFEFWGTKDGRTASRSKPKTWGVKAPPPTKTVESTDLKPGEKKCTEVAHKGISASFDYVVNYPDRTATTTFVSVYKPWQEVCLIGVAPTTTPAVSVNSAN